jgi:hypothetical protein
MATHAEKGMFPVAGGLLDQSAWFIDLWSSLNSEQARIDAERMKGLGDGR